jgi:hypothetical protein
VGLEELARDAGDGHVETPVREGGARELGAVLLGVRDDLGLGQLGEAGDRRVVDLRPREVAGVVDATARGRGGGGVVDPVHVPQGAQLVPVLGRGAPTGGGGEAVDGAERLRVVLPGLHERATGQAPLVTGVGDDAVVALLRARENERLVTGAAELA